MLPTPVLNLPLTLSLDAGGTSDAGDIHLSLLRTASEAPKLQHSREKRAALEAAAKAAAAVAAAGGSVEARADAASIAAGQAFLEAIRDINMPQP